jgi:acetylornithine/succinyldiaminopimelate/putrescine aminotransferase
MIPLLPFFAGIFVGAAALSVLRSERARQMLNDTGARLRKAASTTEENLRATARSGLGLLRGAAAEISAEKQTETLPEAKPTTKQTVRKPVAARPAAPKRAPRKPKKPDPEVGA